MTNTPKPTCRTCKWFEPYREDTTGNGGGFCNISMPPWVLSPVGMNHTKAGAHCDLHKMRPTPELNNIEKAYGLLWRSPITDAMTNHARLLLLESITNENKKAAIKWAIDTCGAMTERELIAAESWCGEHPDFKKENE